MSLTRVDRGFRSFQLPPELQNWIWQTLETSRSESSYRSLAQDVLKMSDFYRDNPLRPTPWQEDWCLRAQLSYFFPLNYVRACAVVEELQRLKFFEGLKSVVDVGSGLGPLAQALPKSFLKVSFVELSERAFGFSETLHPGVTRQKTPTKTDLVTFSFSKTEDIQLQTWLTLTDNLIFIEPALWSDSQSLIELRKNLLAEGWKAWAPCLHQKNCPFQDSEKDWCHDRIHFDRPDWFLAIEKHLPIKNENLTFSYLALSRREAPEQTDLVRTTGDFLRQKGKSKISICRSSKKETLTWLHRHLDPEPVSRGALLQVGADWEDLGSEIRSQTPPQILIKS